MIALLFSALIAHAGEPSPGTIDNSQITVVQPLLHPKAGQNELSLSVGLMPFDAFTKTPNVVGAFHLHRSEALSFVGSLGVGRGFKSRAYRLLSSPTYNVSPDAYRYLGSLVGGVEYAPIYGKLTANGRRVVHHDLFVGAQAGLSYESSLIPLGGAALSPTLSLTVGSRLFTAGGRVIRVALRDDLIAQHRKLSDRTFLKQNVNLMIGVSKLSAKKERR